MQLPCSSDGYVFTVKILLIIRIIFLLYYYFNIIEGELMKKYNLLSRQEINNISGAKGGHCMCTGMFGIKGSNTDTYQICRTTCCDRPGAMEWMFNLGKIITHDFCPLAKEQWIQGGGLANTAQTMERSKRYTFIKPDNATCSIKNSPSLDVEVFSSY